MSSDAFFEKGMGEDSKEFQTVNIDGAESGLCSTIADRENHFDVLIWVLTVLMK